MDKEIVCVCVCISAIKKNKILPPATVWMDFEGIMSSEINRTEKDKSFIISLKSILIPHTYLLISIWSLFMTVSVHVSQETMSFYSVPNISGIMRG